MARLRTWPQLQQLRCLLHPSRRIPVHILKALEAGESEIGGRFIFNGVTPLFPFLPTCQSIHVGSAGVWKFNLNPSALTFLAVLPVAFPDPLQRLRSLSIL